MSRLKPRPPKGIRIAIFRYFDQGRDLAFAASFSLTAFVLAEGPLLFYRTSKGVPRLVRGRDAEVAANLARQIIVNFSVPRHCGCHKLTWITEDRMPGAFTH